MASGGNGERRDAGQPEPPGTGSFGEFSATIAGNAVPPAGAPAPPLTPFRKEARTMTSSALPQSVIRPRRLSRALVAAGIGLLVVAASPVRAQDAEVTCSWVGQRQACHTLAQWEQMARLWCDRYQAAKARREQEQALSWGTNAMYGSSRGAEFTRDQQIEADTLSICSGEQYGLAAAQRQASMRMPQ